MARSLVLFPAAAFVSICQACFFGVCGAFRAAGDCCRVSTACGSLVGCSAGSFGVAAGFGGLRLRRQRCPRLLLQKSRVRDIPCWPIVRCVTEQMAQGAIKMMRTEGEESRGEGNARAAQSVHRTTADEPDHTGCHAGPTIHFDRPPCRNPRPSPHSFPSWARHSVVPSAEQVRWAGGGAFQNSAPR
jgi:hypothetical protein